MDMLLAVCIGCIIDCFLGDPKWLPHPVRLIGWFIARGEKQIRTKGGSPEQEYQKGLILSCLTIAAAFLLPLLLLLVLYKINETLGLIIHALLCWQIIAAKSLKTETMKVHYALANNNLKRAREELSYLVSRDTDSLDRSRIIKSTVETVSENTSDGVIAPLFFMLIGGAPLGFLYKAVNTLDSMIGYKNEKYIRFGRFAAKLDDAVNYIPARISAMVMIAASFLCGYNWRNAVKIYQRDRFNHPSLNSGQTEAVCAGALGIQIGGANYYFGKLVDKPTIGDNLRPVDTEDIIKANRLMYCTFFLAWLAGAVIWLLIMN